MDDLISRAAAIGILGNTPSEICMPWSVVEDSLRALPAVDAVLVVRCKDCKHRGYLIGKEKKYPDDVCKAQCYDSYYSWIPGDDWYCADGERRKADG